MRPRTPFVHGVLAKVLECPLRLLGQTGRFGTAVGGSRSPAVRQIHFVTIRW